MKMTKIVVTCTGILLLFLSATVLAHKASDAYLTLHTDPQNPQILDGQWDIALRDLDHAIGLDGNGDGAITWGEVQAREADIASYALARLSVDSDGIQCALKPSRQLIDTHTDGAYDVLYFSADCDKEIPNTVGISYHLFFDIDPTHRGIITLHNDNHTTSAVLSPNQPHTQLSLNTPNRWRQFKSFVYDGIWHIWTGYDHILFLLSLLLPSVLVRQDRNRGHAPRLYSGRKAPLSQRGSISLALERGFQSDHWQAAPALRPAFVEILKVITAFTISHTCTVTLAVLGIVDLPSRLVESGIALSVILAALNNVYPLINHRLWLVAFSFGLIHGLGFASALSGLSLPPLAMAASIGGFNVGVEVGQESIVLVLMPMAFLMRHTRIYQFYVMRVGSALIMLIACGWLIQRAFGIWIPLFDTWLPR